jgi:hypothetical protein
MTVIHSNDQIHSPSVTLSVMISEAVYKTVVGVERIITLVSKRSGR